METVIRRIVEEDKDYKRIKLDGKQPIVRKRGISGKYVYFEDNLAGTPAKTFTADDLINIYKSEPSRIETINGGKSRRRRRRNRSTKRRNRKSSKRLS